MKNQETLAPKSLGFGVYINNKNAVRYCLTIKLNPAKQKNYKK